MILELRGRLEPEQFHPRAPLPIDQVDQRDDINLIGTGCGKLAIDVDHDPQNPIGQSDHRGVRIRFPLHPRAHGAPGRHEGNHDRLSRDLRLLESLLQVGGKLDGRALVSWHWGLLGPDQGHIAKQYEREAQDDLRYAFAHMRSCLV